MVNKYELDTNVIHQYTKEACIREWIKIELQNKHTKEEWMERKRKEARNL